MAHKLSITASWMNKETSANARFFFHHLIPRIKSSCLVSGIKKHSLQSQRWKEKQGFWFFLFSATEYVYYQQNFADHPHKSIVVECVLKLQTHIEKVARITFVTYIAKLLITIWYVANLFSCREDG